MNKFKEIAIKFNPKKLRKATNCTTFNVGEENRVDLVTTYLGEK